MGPGPILTVFTIFTTFTTPWEVVKMGAATSLLVPEHRPPITEHRLSTADYADGRG